MRNFTVTKREREKKYFLDPLSYNKNKVVAWSVKTTITDVIIKILILDSKCRKREVY